MQRNKKVFLWNDFYIDTEKSTTTLKMHKPVKKEVVITHDEPWEDSSAVYHNIINDDGLYRMYYLTRKKKEGKYVIDGLIVPGLICYAESKDGIRWTKPDLRICMHEGDDYLSELYDNNMILDDKYDSLDNFFVFKDRNPDVPDSERYKGIGVSYKGATDGKDVRLWCHVSEDGIHFKKGWIISAEGTFDSLNSIVWNNEEKKYYCFFRGAHTGEDGRDWRDIRVMSSTDFEHWTKPERITYTNSDVDFQMYTNGMFNLSENEDLFIGLGTRYVERLEWTKNYDHLCGKEKRKRIIELREPRAGLALTDCMLMSSYDGKNFYRFDEALFTGGIEKKDNWVYGDCYPCIGIIETPADDPVAPNEWSLYMKDGHRSGKPALLYRYTVRKDGLASVSSGYKESVMVTKPFDYEGGELHINFSTSAAGHIYVNILDEDGKAINGYSSYEIFGDTLDRIIEFDKPLEELKGRKLRIEFKLSDADLYSLILK